MKAQLHSSYTTEMLLEHGDKPIPPSRCAVIIGSNGLNNIGAAIGTQLRSVGFVTREIEKPTLDAADPRDFEVYLEDLAAEDGFSPDTLICCTGHTAMNWIEDYDYAEVEQVLYDTLLAPINLTRQFVRATIDNPWWKHIVYIGSMAYKSVLNASSPYCAAKAGLAHFASCMAWELTPKGYDVFTVHPSNTEGTPMTERTIEEIMKYRKLNREAAEQYWSSINVKNHWLQPQEIADMVEFLVSGRACHASGSHIDMAGGQR